MQLAVCQCYSPLIFKECCTHLTHQCSTHHIIITCNITINAMLLCIFNWRHPWWPCKSSHLLVSFKPCQPQLASWICSVRAVAFAFEFQASDGSEEQALKSPFEAAVRIKAGWLLNGFPNLSHYSGKVGTKIFRTFIFKMLLWEVSHTRWHIAA